MVMPVVETAMIGCLQLSSRVSNKKIGLGSKERHDVDPLMCEETVLKTVAELENRDRVILILSASSLRFIVRMTPVLSSKHLPKLNSFSNYFVGF